MPAEDPTEIFNHDIVMVHDKCNRYIYELMHSQSNGVSGMIEHDQTRVQTYIDALRSLKTWIVSVPVLDLPETHPRPFKLEAKPEVANVESEAINQFIRLIEALRTEMINSQSARMASTLIAHDALRYDTIVDKMERFLTDYVQQSTPLDLPESSPREGLSPSGRSGV